MALSGIALPTFVRLLSLNVALPAESRDSIPTRLAKVDAIAFGGVGFAGVTSQGDAVDTGAALKADVRFEQDGRALAFRPVTNPFSNRTKKRALCAQALKRPSGNFDASVGLAFNRRQLPSAERVAARSRSR